MNIDLADLRGLDPTLKAHGARMTTMIPNGHDNQTAKTNGHKPQADAQHNGGTGQAIVEGLNSVRHKRQTYLMLQRALDTALDMPPDVMKACWQTAVKDLASQNDRTRIRAREFLLKMQDSGVAAALGLDKIDRLDTGQSTENVLAVKRVILEDRIHAGSSDLDD